MESIQGLYLLIRLKSQEKQNQTGSLCDRGFFLHSRRPTTCKAITHDVLNIIRDPLLPETINDRSRCDTLIVEFKHLSCTTILGPYGELHTLWVRILSV